MIYTNCRHCAMLILRVFHLVDELVNFRRLSISASLIILLRQFISVSSVTNVWRYSLGERQEQKAQISFYKYGTGFTPIYVFC